MRSVSRTVVLVSLGMLVAVALACGEPDVPAPTLDASSARDLPAGAVVGYTSPAGAHAWRGIPFAKPPVGPLRWRAPEALPQWDGLRQALTPGAKCPQFPMRIANEGDPDVPVGQEDCLTLNVFAPRFRANDVPRGTSLRPVMVWIHGGANLTGESGTYDWSRFASTQDTLVVATNYRLGTFGWFRHPALWKDGDDAFDRSGNFGTLDLVRALEWVRDNISAFGGDPNNVTIFGESAGGNNVIALLLSPPAKGLFHRAISQSGGTWSASVAEAENWATVGEAENWAEDAEPGRPFSSREYLAKLLVLDETVPDAAAARAYADSASLAEIERTLRGKSVAELMEVVSDRSKVTMATMPLTIREGKVVRAGEMVDNFAAGRYTRVPTVLGTNRDESKLFFLFDPTYTKKLFGVIPRIIDPARYDRDAEYASAAWKADGADEIAIEMRRHQSDVFAYRFDWDEQPSRFGTDFAQLVGAAHGLEIPFVMGVELPGPLGQLLGGEKTAASREVLSTKMRSYWAQFAKTGDPARGSDGLLPEWRAWDSSSERSARFMVFDTDADGGLRMSSDYQTAPRIARRVVADPRFTPDERCKRLKLLAEGSTRYSEEDRAATGC